MKKRITGAGLIIACAGVLATSATAGQDNGVVSMRRAGPIIRDETTFNDVRNWFGEPDRKRRHDYQCIRVIDAVWRGKFKILFDTFDNNMVVAIVRDPSVLSGKHGEIKFRTKKGLQVGDRARKLHRLYPNAERHEHNNFNHHILRRGDGTLEATTEDSRVTELRTFPYEAC